MSTGEELKNQGNKFFENKKYTDAINSYTRAISRCPAIANYYTNRALCYIHVKDYMKAVHDCQKAVELDRSSIKAYYFWGRSALLSEQYDEAIKLFVKAVDLATGHGGNFGDEIHSQIRIARREKFKQEECKKIQQEINLSTYLKGLITDDIERRTKDLKKDDPERERIASEAHAYENQFMSILSQIDERRRKREIPDYLCGKISFEVLRDPVITPSGITYDRADIKQHLQRVGHFDPVTRAELREEDLVPNLAMKEVVEAFLHENPWAEYEDLID
ncbi:unnamed protein product [Auanema sp. JU1783]|nr:unnamed protein product [Auanema sp. JU1783]